MATYTAGTGVLVHRLVATLGQHDHYYQCEACGSEWNKLEDLAVGRFTEADEWLGFVCGFCAEGIPSHNEGINLFEHREYLYTAMEQRLRKDLRALNDHDAYQEWLRACRENGPYPGGDAIYYLHRLVADPAGDSQVMARRVSVSVDDLYSVLSYFPGTEAHLSEKEATALGRLWRPVREAFGLMPLTFTEDDGEIEVTA